MNLLSQFAHWASVAAPFVYGCLALWAALCALFYVLEHLRQSSTVYRFWYLCILAGCLAAACWTITFDSVRPPDLLIMAGVAGLMTCLTSRRAMRKAKQSRHRARVSATTVHKRPIRRAAPTDDISRDTAPDAA